ncbi:T9SS type A sorting domain-containing protein [Algibacter amylolyticus]|uniref:T9SS type A sorting domain-containing protein n=1 Tax=Algibacter amylolyticus TaxID=1608400 RepID=A0A5M7BCA5_9FLAO|nr:T9SS type A sorting domain-containing protein [Algibacter amylolyticus]KAA5826310.1 T9SS type A sorting domain-containing protein [Algibacter amylolyticus]MBB5268513.1 hypothetical protein [Algibacter amylolyticus]TSJ80348.1 T9SS type A sorting domain-containing protein [Algibacter amylolyticus]
MRKITLSLLFLIITISLNAQTVAWSSDSEDYATADWGILDSDEDGNNWSVYTGGGESLGFSSGAIFYSESWNSTAGALQPDNILFTPIIAVASDAVTISYKMKVAALFSPDFAEKFAVYVYDNDDETAGDILIYEETLTAGGDGTAKDITAEIPASFAGKNIGIYIRHYDCTNQYQIAVDDFEVSYTTSLSVNDNTFKITKAYPNPVLDIIKIDTKNVINSALIINQLGQTVLNIKSNKIVNNSIDLTGLKQGLYFLNLKSEGRSATIKITKN